MKFSMVSLNLFLLAALTTGCAGELSVGNLDEQTELSAEDIGQKEQGITCETNCSHLCDRGTIKVPCPTWRKPTRTCPQVVIDPVCKTTCETEREFHCRTGLNACSAYEAVDSWRIQRDLIRSLKDQGLTAAECENIVKLGGAAAGAAQKAYVVIVEGLKEACKVNPIALAIAKGAEHAAICACYSALD